VLGRARERIAAAEPPPHELRQPHVCGGQLVVAALAVQREHLYRPPSDSGDRAEPSPGSLVVGVVQIDPPARHLARSAHERQRTGAGKVERLQERRRGPGEHGGRREVSQTAVHPT
jgi:hypothetical protein